MLKPTYRHFALVAVTWVLGCSNPGKQQQPPAGTSAPHSVAAPADALPAGHDALVRAAAGKQPSTGGERVSGQVREVIQVAQYTYLRVGPDDKAAKWVAIASTPVEKGQNVSVLVETTLKDFESPSLHRKFETIGFGSLEPAETASSAEGCLGHTENSALAGTKGVCPHQGDPSGSGCGSHTATDATPTLHVKNLPKAEGPLGRTVSEIIDNRRGLDHQLVHVTATVVKVTPDVLGKTYLHVRDGSGTEKSSNNDLVVTTKASVAKGDTLTLAGTVGNDRDLGSGYRFDAIVDDAVVLKKL